MRTSTSPHPPSDVEQLSAKCDCLTLEISQLRDLLAQCGASAAIVPLEVAAERVFRRRVKTVKQWVDDGYIRARRLPFRGGYVYFVNLGELWEDLENFTSR